MSCQVFIAVSVDGFIATPDGGVEWLDDIGPVDGDMGWGEFIADIDALVMGRGSFEKVLSFGFWPYEVPVIVMSSTLKEIPDHLADKAELSDLAPEALVAHCVERSWNNLYIDGGKVISSFMNLRLIDKLTITTVPVILGAGIPLFSDIADLTWLDHVSAERYENGLVTNTYTTRSA